VSDAGPAARRERHIFRTLDGFAWAGCAALFAFTFARWSAYEGAIALALYGLTPWLYLPVYAAVGYAFAARRRVLLGATLCVVVIHGVAIWPDIKPPDRLSSEVKAAPRLRVFSANLHFANDDLSGIIDEVRARDADVAVFQEVTRTHRARLLREPALALLSHRIEADSTDTMIMSRVPFETSDVWPGAYRPMARARLSTAIGPVDLVAVHTAAPTSATTISHWRRMMRQLRDLAAQRDNPVLLVGDFNATVYHSRFDELLDTGLTDAHSARGTGMVGTWPRDRAFPPLLRIDHALSSEEIVPVAASYGTGRGSDHRPIFVEYALVGDATS
jgi:endonuclease/exonuclease/phosphatase (EEP) superfamily protein YafD